MKLIPDALLDRPFEILIGFLCAQSGAVMAATGIAPNSVTGLLPPLLIHVWGMVLLLGGSLLLVGLGLRYIQDKFVLGLLVERAGYYPLISGTLIYSAVIIIRAGWSGTFPMLTYLVFAGVCALRAARITSTVNQLQRLGTNE